MTVSLSSLAKPQLAHQPGAGRFHIAYLAHMELAGVIAEAGLHADALAALRFAIECFFKCVYQCALDQTFGASIWSDRELKASHKPRAPNDFSHDVEALVRVLEHLTDLPSSREYRELKVLLTELPSIEERYEPRDHSGAQPRFEDILRSFNRFLEFAVAHLR